MTPSSKWPRVCERETLTPMFPPNSTENPPHRLDTDVRDPAIDKWRCFATCAGSGWSAPAGSVRPRHAPTGVRQGPKAENSQSIRCSTELWMGSYLFHQRGATSDEADDEYRRDIGGETSGNGREILCTASTTAEFPANINDLFGGSSH